MKSLSRSLACAALLGLLAIAPSPTASISASPETVSALKAASVLVLLPSAVPKDFGKVVLVAHVGKPWTSVGGYEVVVGFTPDCDGTACTAAYVTGEKGRMHNIPSSATKVVLKRGGRAYYVSQPCRTNCGDSAVLHFERAGANYLISVKAGTLADTIAIADNLVPLAK